MLHCATVLKQHQCKARTYLNFIYLRSVTDHQKSNDAQYGLNQLTGGRGFAGARYRVQSAYLSFQDTKCFYNEFLYRSQPFGSSNLSARKSIES